jgi:hypothetical protein
MGLSEVRWRPAAGISAATVVVLLLLWKAPAWQVMHTPGTTTANRFDREDEARKTLAQIIGGAVVLVGLYMSFRTFDLSREGQITDRFTKAIEQLGKVEGSKPNIEMRLGAIYALERIAIDSARDHWTVMEVLTTYVRRNARLRPSHAYVEGETPRIDIQAILIVLGRRKVTVKREDPYHYQCVNLSGCRLCGADLRYINLLRADFRKADLRGVQFNGTDLRGAWLHGADLQGAQLEGASLQNATLDEAKLQRANLEWAKLEGASLWNANLQGANLSRATMPKAMLYRTDFHGALNLTAAQIRSAIMWDSSNFSPDLRRELDPPGETPGSSNKQQDSNSGTSL